MSTPAKVLVVDDTPNNVKLLADILTASTSDRSFTLFGVSSTTSTFAGVLIAAPSFGWTHLGEISSKERTVSRNSFRLIGLPT